jgi:hypothetical protein
MKRIITSLVSMAIALFISGSASAQSPEKMSYQAVIRNSSDVLLTNTPIGIEINIRQGSPSGTIVYTETQTPTTNANGLISIEIGGVGFSSINWANDIYFIETKTAIEPPLTTYTITGTSQLLSVPYALHAKTAGTLSGNGSFNHYVGELFGGGIVVSVWKENGVEHGLIASLTDVSASAQWSSITGTLIGATAQSPIDGQANTNAIIAQGDVSGAAYLCDIYTSGGFSDWYLPAAWELNQCYNAAFVINTILGATNGFQFDFYWSSTEYVSTNAWNQVFYNGYTNGYIKSSYHRVRAVRRF